MTRICLNMIVKNEADRIARCLASVAPYISCWAITDTGSTDGTEDLIQKFFTEYPGRLDHAPFIDFSQARNVALMNANSDAGLEFDYLLLIDADMELVVEDKTVFDHLTAPVYQMVQRSNALTYWNTRLLRRVTLAHYVGVTHEYLDTRGIRPEMLHGAFFRDHADGANRPGKIERDIALLEDDVRDKARSFFYLGNSYKEAGKLAEAASAYETRSRLGGWAEEVWRARLERARTLRDANNFPGFVEEALAAFASRPWRAEPLYDLAKAYRERGMNEAALIFAERGLRILKPADDLLFIEDHPYDVGFREEISIAGFYSSDPETRELGHKFCEELALSRNISRETHEQAWRNLFHYTKLLSEYAPSYRAKRIEFEPPDGYCPMNPSVTRLGATMYLNVRAVNYRIAPEGHYVMPEGETSIRTRNFLFYLAVDLTEHLLGEITFPDDLSTPANSAVLGFEDIRLFPIGNELWCNATTRQLNPEGWGEIVTARIDADHILTDWSVIHPQGERRHEKNWMPFACPTSKEATFIYSCDPIRIIRGENGTTFSETTPPISASEWSGSSQAIPFEMPIEHSIPNENWTFHETYDGFLALIHERIARPGIGKRQYQRRFVWFDQDLNIRRISRRFQFTDQSAGHEGGEFVCGMCMHPDGKRLVISHGLLDREAWLVTVDADEVRAMLRDVGPSTIKATTEDGVVTEITFSSGGTGYEKTPIDWLRENTNTTLRHDTDVNDAIYLIKRRGWPAHPDRPKNWDVFLAVNHTQQFTKPHEAILDAGGDKVSTYLPTLRRLGYTSLTSLNLKHERAEKIDNIYYLRGDITATSFPDREFAFISCLSTIEHGVEVVRFLTEASRLLQYGGHLFVSTDFWASHINTKIDGWHIFTPQEIKYLIDIAAENRLLLTSPANLVCNEQVVKHAGLEYTFLSLLFRKAD